MLLSATFLLVVTVLVRADCGCLEWGQARQCDQDTDETCSWYSSDSCCTEAQLDVIGKIEDGNCMNKEGVCCHRLSDACAGHLMLLSCGGCAPGMEDYVTDGAVDVCYTFAKNLYNNCLRDEFFDVSSEECRVIGSYFEDGNEWLEREGRYWLGAAKNAADANSNSSTGFGAAIEINVVEEDVPVEECFNGAAPVVPASLRMLLIAALSVFVF